MDLISDTGKTKRDNRSTVLMANMIKNTASLILMRSSEFTECANCEPCSHITDRGKITECNVRKGYKGHEVKMNCTNCTVVCKRLDI